MSDDNIPLVDLAWQHGVVGDKVLARWADMTARGAFIGGDAVDEFERAFSDYCDADHVVGVANGTDALELVLATLGVGAGDEVIVPTNTFFATAEAVVAVGATPVFVDCDRDTYLIDPTSCLEALTPKTRAVMGVHLYGQLAPLEEIAPELPDRVALVEDAAQCQGARRNGRPLGSFGVAAGTSFYPGKNLGAYGDAGAVVTSDPDLERGVRLRSQHGALVRHHHEVSGRNSRLDALQAVVLTEKLAHLDDWNRRRIAAAALYDELLADVGAVRTPTVAAGNEPVWHLYVVEVDNRDDVLAAMNTAGVGASIHYPLPVHVQPAFATDRLGPPCPVAEQAAPRLLSLPIFPGITEAQQTRVVDVLRRSVRR